MLILQGVSYSHPNKDLLFTEIDLSLSAHEKLALVGNNGSGKSTLLKIMSGQLRHSSGYLRTEVPPYYVPQLSDPYHHLTIAQVLQVDQKLMALENIVKGDTTSANFDLLNDDWTIEERCNNALAYWQVASRNLLQPFGSLSGGERTKVFLAGLLIHEPGLILFDEPSNHLDRQGRELLYEFIRSNRAAMIVVSHDRKLLNLLPTVCELGREGVKLYGGNYDFYKSQKQFEHEALVKDIDEAEKSLRKAKVKERETIQRQQKLDARGKGKQEKAGVAKIMMNTLRNKAEKSTAKAMSTHDVKIEGMLDRLDDLRSAVPKIDTMKFNLPKPSLHSGKVLLRAINLNYDYGNGLVWKTGIDIEIRSGERMVLHGTNGSGKTTLINLIQQRLSPTTGDIWRAVSNSIYIDQDYSLLSTPLSVYEQANRFNDGMLAEHEIKIRLSRFLFDKDSWDRSCLQLSGGERMRLMLCCFTLINSPLDLIILDEPTNNLDIQNVEMLTAAIRSYEGTLLVVSHDEQFLADIHVSRVFSLLD